MRKETASGTEDFDYLELQFCIFDKKTGEIVAIETQAVPKKERKRIAGQGPSDTILKSLAADRGVRQQDLDYIEINAIRPEEILLRVDPKTRKLARRRLRPDELPAAMIKP